MFQQFFLAEHQTVLANVADGLLYAGVPRRRAAPPGGRRARAGRPGTPGRRPAHPAVRRGAAAGGDRPGHRRPPADGAGRRADRQPGLRDRRGASLTCSKSSTRPATTIIVITHDHAVAARMRRRIEVLDGRIITDTGPAHRRDRGRARAGRTLMTVTSRLRPRPGPAAPGRPGRAGQRRAADPQAAGGAVGAGHRDRGGRDRRRPRPGQLLPGRAAGRDRAAGHQPADRHQRDRPHRRSPPSCPTPRRG